MNRSWKELEQEYSGNVPEGIAAEWYAAVDKSKMSKLDEVFMQEVYQFYKNALDK